MSTIGAVCRFHHHAIGVHQVEQITETDGILVQELFADPNVPHPAELIINDAEIRARFVRALQSVPIMLDCVPVELVDVKARCSSRTPDGIALPLSPRRKRRGIYLRSPAGKAWVIPLTKTDINPGS